jgi:hypothetical protein
MPMQEHSYRLSAMTAPAAQDVQAALAVDLKENPTACQNF